MEQKEAATVICYVKSCRQQAATTQQGNELSSVLLCCVEKQHALFVARNQIVVFDIFTETM